MNGKRAKELRRLVRADKDLSYRRVKRAFSKDGAVVIKALKSRKEANV